MRTKVDFKEISEKYPKAWGKLLEWQYNGENTGSWTMGGTPNEFYPYPDSIRTLYDFFDSEGIRVTVDIFEGYETQWHYYIFQPTPEGKDKVYKWEINPDIDIKEFSYLTRPEAEEQAFLKAFEILENKL